MTGDVIPVPGSGYALPGGLRDLGIGGIRPDIPVPSPEPQAPAASVPPGGDADGASGQATSPPGISSGLYDYLTTGKAPTPAQNTPDTPIAAGSVGPFTTALSPAEEASFQKWAKQNKVPWQDDARADYDMRGYWKAAQAGDPGATTAINQSDNRMHFPDTWKTPYHQTFSNESIYAGPGAPQWQGNVLVGQDGKIIADERTPAEKRAAQKAAKTQTSAATAGAGGGAGVPTLGQAYAQSQDAAAAQIGAVRQEGDIAAQQADAVFQARAAADKTLADAKAELERKLARDAEVRAEKQAAVDAANKEVDNFKVDQNRYWKGLGTGKKIGLAISMALSGLGDAIQGKSGPNPVIGMLDTAVQRSVQLQMDQRDALRQKAARAGQSLDAADRFSQNRFAQEQYLLAQAFTMAGRQVETAGAKYGSAEARARTQSLAAGLYKQAADAGQKAAEFATTDQRQREQIAEQKAARMAQVGLGYATLGETRRHNMAEEAKDKRAEELKLELAAMKAGGKSEAELKAIRDRAIGGEVTPIKDEKGNVVGSKLGLMRTSDGEVWVPTGTEASVTELQKQHVAATALIQTLDKIRALGPTWMSDIGNSDTKRKLDQLMGDARLQAIAAKGLGVPTGHDIELAENFLGTSDPTKLRNQLAGIMQSRESIVRDHNVLLKAHGYDRDWAPVDPNATVQVPEAEAAAALEKEKTPVEAGQGAAGGAGRAFVESPRDATYQGAKALVTGVDYKTAADERVAAAEANASTKYPGLTPEQEPQMDTLLRSLAGKDKAAADRARAALVDTVRRNAEKRPEYASGVLNALRDNAPGVYEEARDTLPPGETKAALEAQDRERAKSRAETERAIRDLPTPALIAGSRGGDPIAWNEVTARAEKGDQAAQAALARRDSLTLLEKKAVGGDPIAKLELARRADAEVKQNGGPPTQQQQIDDAMPAYSALTRLRVGVTP